MAKVGRPKGRTLKLALEQAGKAAEHSGNMLKILEKMSDRQRKVFLQLSKGKDELQSLADAGMIHEINGVAKKVYLKSGKGMMVSSIKSALDLEELEEESYERLLRLAKSIIAHMAGTTDYRDYLVDITDFFKAIAPEAFAVIAEIMGNDKVSAAIRLKAATAMLDRGGYSNATPDQGNELPVKMVLNFDATPRLDVPVETIDATRNS